MREILSKIIDLLQQLLKTHEIKKEEPSEPAKSKKGFLAIVVGHTKRSSGAWAAKPIGLSEYALNTEIAKEIAAACKQKGIDGGIYFRDKGGIKTAYREVAADFKKHSDKECCAIELHFNAYNKKAYGTETLFVDNGAVDERMFANMVHKSMVKAFGRTGRGDRGLRIRSKRGERGFYNLVQITKKPSVLVEPGFLDNPSEAELFKSRRSRYVAGIAEAVSQWVNR